MMSFYQRVILSPLMQVTVFYATFALFVLELAADILGLARSVRIGFLQPQDIALILCVGYMALICPRFWESITSKTSLAYALAIVLFTGVGVVLGNHTGWIRTDLRFFFWVYGGFAFISLWWQLPRAAFHLYVVQAALVFLLFMAMKESHATHFQDERFEEGRDRLYGLNLFAVGSIMLYFLALHYTVLATRSRLGQLSAGVVTAIFFYIVLYLSATRNLLLAYLAMAGACLPAFLFQVHRGFFSRRILGPRLAICLVLVVGGTIMLGLQAQELLIIKRFEGGNILEDASARGRIVELQRVLSDFDRQQLITGAGLGETFRPDYTYEANFLHLGIAGVVLKLGLPVGLTLAAFLYVGLPLILAWALFRPSTLTPPVRTAIYAAIPVTFPWLVQLGISGGFTPTHSLGVGMAIAVASHCAQSGLRFVSPEETLPGFAPSPFYRTA